MQITLTEEELQILIELLQEEVRDVRSENYHAETHDVKSLLKHRETIVKGLLERLQS